MSPNTTPIVGGEDSPLGKTEIKEHAGLTPAEVVANAGENPDNLKDVSDSMPEELKQMLKPKPNLAKLGSHLKKRLGSKCTFVSVIQQHEEEFIVVYIRNPSTGRDIFKFKIDGHSDNLTIHDYDKVFTSITRAYAKQEEGDTDSEAV